nr:cyclic peptide export ABC transporter [Methylosinus sp. KRF6]
MNSSSAALLSYAIGLLRPFWKTTLSATAMGGASGLAAVSLISLVDRELHAETPAPATLLLSLAGLTLLLLASEIVSGVGNSLVGQNIIAEVRKDLTKKILCAPIAEIERLQAHRIITTLNQDVDRISEFTRGLSYIVVASCQTLGCVAYLIYLSWPMFLIGVVVGAAAYAAIRLTLKSAYKNLADERAAVDELQRSYRALVEGAKELRVNKKRRLHFYEDQLSVAIDRIRESSNRAFARFVAGGALDSASFFAITGTLIGLAPVFGANKSDLAAFVLVLMYMKGPMSQVVTSLPMFNLALVSFEKVLELSQTFAGSENALLEAPPASAQVEAAAVLEFRNIHFSFPRVEGAEPFTLGPIDLVVRTGETLFITGENGSGKTTLIKLILGLYLPTDGQILLNSAIVDDESRDDYRQHFSAIFFDFFLFDDLIAADETAMKAARRHLERLDISHKVSIEAGKFTTTDLSTGQRKRLALVGAYLEQRPIFVLDEWAAEQDPTFRRIFYQEILPELKADGKTLIVVSHDDRYFDAADRIIHIEGGCIVGDSPPCPPSLEFGPERLCR